MAYDNWDIQTLSDDASDSGDWSASTGTDLWAMIDEDISSPNTSDYITTTTTNGIYSMDANGFSRNVQEYEFVRIRFHARRVGGTTASLKVTADTGMEGVSEDITTSWATYVVAYPVRADERTGAQLDGTLPYTSNSAYEVQLVAILTGGAEIQIATVEVSVLTLADHGYIIPNADGTTTNWTLSTGTSSYAVVDNVTGIGVSDWTGGNDDTTDYMYTNTDSTVVELGLTTPTYTGVGVGDVVMVWLCHYANNVNANNGIQIDLIEGGSPVASQLCGYGSNGGLVRWDNANPRFSMELLAIDTAITDWADVQLRVTSVNVTSLTEFRIYSAVVIGPFDYFVPTNYDVSITEAITVGDTQAGIMGVFRSIAEGVAVGDTQSGLAGALGSLAEGVAVGDTQSGLATAYGAITEGVSLGDVIDGLNVVLVSIAEGISVGDTQSALVSALASLSEGVAVGDTQDAIAAALAAIAEGITTGDIQAGLATAYGILSEGVAVGDAITGLQLFLAAITESIIVGDTQSASAAALGAFAEALAVGDAPSATATALAALTEGIATAEVFAAVAAAYGAISEGISVGETWSYPLIGAHLVGTFSIEPLLAATTSNQALLSATVTVEGLEGATITMNR